MGDDFDEALPDFSEYERVRPLTEIRARGVGEGARTGQDRREHPTTVHRSVRRNACIARGVHRGLVAALSGHHRDPLGRMLIAEPPSCDERTLTSGNHRSGGYAVDVLW